MYKMKSINAVATISIICFIALELIMIFEMMIKIKTINISIVGGSAVVLVISVLVGLLFLPISNRYFYYELTEHFLVIKYYFKESKLILTDIRSINFEKDHFEVFFKDGAMLVEKNRMNKNVYENFQKHFTNILNTIKVS